MLDDEVAGAFYMVWWTKRTTLAERELALVEHVASQVTVVLRHARLFDQAQRERRQLDVLYEISRRLAAAEDTGQVLSLLVDETTGLLRRRGGGDPPAGGRGSRGGRAHALGGPGHGAAPDPGGREPERRGGRDRRAGDGRGPPRGHALRSGPQGGRDRGGVPGVPRACRSRSAGGPSAACSSSASNRRRFSPEDISLLSALGDHASLAIHKARLYAESRAREQEATKLYEVTTHLTATLDVDSVLDQIVDKTVDLLGCDASGVYVPDEARGGLALPARAPPRPDLTRDLVLAAGRGRGGARLPGAPAR